MSWLFKKHKNITTITQKINRIDAEDMLDQDYTCKEITETLYPEVTDQKDKDILIKRINNIKLGKQRREAKLGINSNTGELSNPLIEAKNELAAEKIKLEIDKLKLAKEKLEAERQDYFGSDDDEEETEAQDPLTAMIMGFLSKKSGADPYTQTGSPPGVIGSAPQQQQQPQNQQVSTVGTTTLNDDEILAVMDQYAPQMKSFQKLPDSVILKYLRSNYPQLAEETNVRILSHVKKKEIVN